MTAVSKTATKRRPLQFAVAALCRHAFAEQGNEGAAWIPGRTRQGQQAHRRVQQNAHDKHSDCFSEMELAWEGRLLDTDIKLTGRADLVFADGSVEEIKTLLLEPGRFKRLKGSEFPSHSTQALLYSWMYHPSEIVTARLRLINLADGAERVVALKRPAAELLTFLEAQVAAAVSRHAAEQVEVARRCQLAEELRFPFAGYRPGQQELIEQIEQALTERSILGLAAPTGTGKSVSTLFPALKSALRAGKRVFFCTAKNTGRQAALDVIHALRMQGAPLTAVAMAAREGMCPSEVYFCHEEHCPFLVGMQKRMEEALNEARKHPVITPEELVALGVRFRVCPHELGLSLCETRDLLVGDYNYVLDPQVRIRRLFVEGDPSAFVVLVDEVHNLAPRARGWFSAEISLEQLDELLRELDTRDAQDGLFETGPLTRVYHGLRQAVVLLREMWLDAESMFDDEFVFARDPREIVRSATFDLDRLNLARGRYEARLIEYMLLSVVMGVARPRDPLILFYRDLERFADLAARRDESLRQVVRVGVGDSAGELCFSIVCSWAGDWVSERMSEFHAVVLFSATPKPWEFTLRELGLDGHRRCVTIDVPSPFPPENRLLVIHEGFSSRLRDRGSGMENLARIVSEVFERVGGNTAVFLPSFAYLRALRSVLPKSLPLLVHDGAMEPKLRQALLTKMSRGRPQLLLSVMGGIFAEAVDYPGRMLEAAIVVGPGLPQLSHERELARLYYDGQGDPGFDYAYRLPGLCRVLQAAGRVIRRPEDRGSILLLCDRFNEWDNRRVIEEYYDDAPRLVFSTDELLELVARFHQGEGEDNA